MRHLIPVLVLATFGSALPAWSQAKTPAPEPRKESKKEAAPSVPCEEHGVRKTICSRCNPKLEAVYKSKGDWCPEHARAESQCVICNPELKKKGVKP